MEKLTLLEKKRKEPHREAKNPPQLPIGNLG